MIDADQGERSRTPEWTEGGEMRLLQQRALQARKKTSSLDEIESVKGRPAWPDTIETKPPSARQWAAGAETARPRSGLQVKQIKQHKSMVKQNGES